MLNRFWLEWRGLLIFLVVMVLFRSAIADWNQVPTGSMKPTILDGDRVIVNKLAYGLRVPFSAIRVLTWDRPNRGEIVTFFSPENAELLIKRVVGIPGDRISLMNNQLKINDRIADYAVLDEDQIPALNAYERHRHRFYLETIKASVRAVMLRPAPPNAHNNFGPVEVPEGHYLMLGDNRDNSKDSRYIGLIPAQAITGRAHAVAFSVDYENYYLPRGDHFFKSLARSN